MKHNYKPLLRVLCVILLDLLLIAACGGLAMLARFEFSFGDVPDHHRQAILLFIRIQCGVTLVIFWLRKMYHYVWRTVSAYDVADMIISTVLACCCSYACARLLGIRPPTSVALIDLMCLIITQVGMRCSLRFYNIFLSRFARAEQDGERIMLIGAGKAGSLLLNEIQSSSRPVGNVVCIVDDNPTKNGKMMSGVPILGNRDQILTLAKQYNITQIIFAIPGAAPADKKDILLRCQKTGCKVKTIPGIYESATSDIRLSDVQDVKMEDLLGREPVRLNLDSVSSFLRGKVILVTGGGGSIGSELCRQIMGYHPRRLVILDIYENNAYDIQQELRTKFPGAELQVEIASVRERETVYGIFDRHRPEVVFHAAAHKHVPLMENCPEEAVKNNIFGTYHVVRAAEKYGTAKFVMISTDKAVNPTNIMGATKRFCEMILQSRPQSGTEFCAVRFGNVLGSNGSVVPLFKRQIEAGGPVTITDKRIIRYFMTIPEAAQLVLEAGAMAKRGQLFVLDMGEPVKILSLAENLIRLSGLKPYEDIEIREIGLRPGEKLYEELLMQSETLLKTTNKKIFVEQQTSIPEAVIREGLERLDQAVADRADKETFTALLKELVPTYRDPEEINRAVTEGAAVSDAKAVPAAAGQR